MVYNPGTATTTLDPYAPTQQPIQALGGIPDPSGSGNGGVDDPNLDPGDQGRSGGTPTTDILDQWRGAIQGYYDQYLERSASEGELDAQVSAMGDPGLAGPNALSNMESGIRDSREARGHGHWQRFAGQMAEMAEMTDPAVYEQRKGTIWADIQNALYWDGFDVQASGDQLIIDGRPYEVAWPGLAPTRQLFDNGPNDWGPGPAVPPGTVPPPSPPPSLDGNPGGVATVQSAAPPNYAELVVPPEPPPAAEWEQTRSGNYQPGEVTFGDIPDYGMDGAAVADPSRVDATSEFDAGSGLDPDIEASIQDLIRNPSIDQRTIDILKAQAKEELTQGHRQENENIVGLASRYNIEDSNWMASEQAMSDRELHGNLAGVNADIEIEAARTNTADRRAATQLGAQFASDQGQRQLAEDQAASRHSEWAQSLNMQEEQFTEQLNFSYESMQRNSAFQTAALTGDRMQLRESVNAEAERLGLASDQLQLQYTLALADDAIQKYGIELGGDIDIARLGEQSREFQEDLSFRFTQLATSSELQLLALQMSSEQFKAQYGLDFVALQFLIDSWNREQLI